MKKRYIAMILCIAMLLPMVLQAVPAVFAEEKSVTILHGGKSVKELVVPYTEKETLTASTVGITPTGYQWQILADSKAELWVDILDKTEPTCEVSYPMVKNLMDASGSAYLRCAVTVGEEEVYSDTLCVIMDMTEPEATSVEAPEAAQVAPAPLPAPVASDYVMEEDPQAPNDAVIVTQTMDTQTASTLGEGESSEESEDSVQLPDETTTICTVTIDYIYTDATTTDSAGNVVNVSKFAGQRVALPYVAEVHAGNTLDQVVTSPSCVGYSPDQASVDLSKLGQISSDMSLVVKYSPATVSYTVRHYQQNIYDDEYTWVDTTMATGLTESLTSDTAAKTYEGFTALSHYHEEIAADGSTTIDIYYDRDYYLMSFDLDGGYGVEAIYARYGADISVADPQRAGYSFDAWSLDGITAILLPNTVPAYNSSYTALWTAGSTSYTIAYWLENADTDDKYDFVGAVSVSADSGISVSGDDTAVENDVFTDTERKYYAYNRDKTDADIIVAGDGSTVVNVYYDRNEYVLRFYFARSFEGKNGVTYYQISHRNSGYDTVGENVSASDWTDGRSNKYFITKPILSDDYTENSCTLNDDDTYTYYFFDLTVKYGQDISNIWPHTEPITNATDEITFGVKFVSWGTEPGSGYYNKNSNKNIKGPYSIVDSDLLVDAAVVSPAVNHSLVAYYGSPTMWTVYLYYSAMNGETNTKTYAGEEYVLQGDPDNPIKYGAQIDSVDELDVLSFPGVQFVGRVDKKNNKDESNSYSTQWYYNRIEHTIVFDDNYGAETKTYTIPYGATISSYITTEPTPTYPDELPVGAYEFDGWYQSKEGIGELDTSITMPNKDLIYYAKWNPVVYTVTINDGNGTVLSTQQVSYGSKATKPTDPVMDNASFIGWYYKDTSGDEQRFDFDNMTVTKNIEIYAKWRSDDMKEVELYYLVDVGEGKGDYNVTFDSNGDAISVVADENGEYVKVADTETFMLRVGQTRTFEAKTGNSLYSDYQVGCFPTTASHSVTPTDADLESALPIQYAFVYKNYGTVPYQVEFYVKEENGTERPAFITNDDGTVTFVEAGKWEDEYEKRAYIEEHKDNNKAVVVELYEPDVLANLGWELPEAYLPDALKVQKIIVPSATDPDNIEANTIKFIYTYTEEVDDPEPEDPNNPGKVYESKYLVQHFVQNVNNTDTYGLYKWEELTGYSTKTATANPINIPGYTYDYEVTATNKQAGTTLAAGDDSTKNTMDDVLSGTISAKDELELNFYYKANSYPYQVMYLEKDTNRVLYETKTTDGTNTLKDLYGAKVSEDAVSIDGYQVDAASKSIYIQMEAGETASINTIVFYYERLSADLVISKTVALDKEQAEKENISKLPDFVDDQEFEFTIYSPTGFHKLRYNYTKTTADSTTGETGELIAGTTTMTFKLIPGQTITIEDLAIGNYTVTETYVPGFRCTVDDTITQKASVSITQESVEAGKDHTVDFVNTYPYYTGDLVIKKNVVMDGTDLATNTSYKVKVVLNPNDEAREVPREITFVDGEGNAVRDADGNETFVIPAITGTNDDVVRQFTINISVPAGGEVKLVGVPAGTFTTTEVPNGVGYITDYYAVTYNKALHQNDEVTGTAYSVSGEIHGGHPTAVTYTNTCKKGSLTINKTVTQEYVNDNWTNDTFTFAVTGTTELPVGDYKILVNDVEKTAKVEAGSNGKNVVTIENVTVSVEKQADSNSSATEWSKELTIKNLPAGYYTVTEDLSTEQKEKYTTTPDSLTQGDLLVNSTETPTTAEFKNIYNRTTGNLKISKTIEIKKDGHEIKPDVAFEFVVLLDDPDDAEDAILTGEYSYKQHSNNNTLETTDDMETEEKKSAVGGELTFTLKHGEWVEIQGLPVGKYTIKEKIVDGYDSSFTGGAGDDPYTYTTATVTTDGTENVSCVNSYPVYTANLTITREKAEPGQVFVYNVKNADGTIDIDVTIQANDDGTGSVTIADLPYDSSTGKTDYTVIQKNDWSWRYTDGSANATVDKDGGTVNFSGGSSTQWLSGNSNRCSNKYNAGGGTS